MQNHSLPSESGATTSLGEESSRDRRPPARSFSPCDLRDVREPDRRRHQERGTDTTKACQCSRHNGASRLSAVTDPRVPGVRMRRSVRAREDRDARDEVTGLFCLTAFVHSRCNLENVRRDNQQAFLASSDEGSTRACIGDPRDFRARPRESQVVESPSSPRALTPPEIALCHRTEVSLTWISLSAGLPRCVPGVWPPRSLSRPATRISSVDHARHLPCHRESTPPPALKCGLRRSAQPAR
jgi:hypothetical protein